MAQISFTDLVNGTVPDASDFNSRLNALKNRINNGMETDNIAATAVTTAKIANSAVTATQLATDAVETAKIKDDNVTTAKLAAQISPTVANSTISGSAAASDTSTANHFRVITSGQTDIQENFTLSNPTNGEDGQRVVWEFTQDSTGGRTITLGADFRVPADIGSITLSLGASLRDYMAAIYNSTDTKWDIVSFIKGVDVS